MRNSSQKRCDEYRETLTDMVVWLEDNYVGDCTYGQEVMEEIDEKLADVVGWLRETHLWDVDDPVHEYDEEGLPIELVQHYG